MKKFLKKQFFFQFIILGCILGASVLASAQNKTNGTLLYNEKREFRTDTNLTITLNQYKLWLHVEDSILTMLSERLVANLKSEVAANKIVERNIFSFVYNTDTIQGVSQVKVVSGPSPNKGAIERVKSHASDILKILREANRKYHNNRLEASGRYYIFL